MLLIRFFIYIFTLLIGGYKGFGLAMMVEVFCGILSGSAFGPHLRKWQGEEMGQADLVLEEIISVPQENWLCIIFMSILKSLVKMGLSYPVLDTRHRSSPHPSPRSDGLLLYLSFCFFRSLDLPLDLS